MRRLPASPVKLGRRHRTTAHDSRTGFSPDNWAHQALLQMDEAEATVRWASVSMRDVAQYHRSAQAFWAVVHRLAAERERLETVLRETSVATESGRRRAARRRGSLPRVR